jgi:hypothetical protein
VSDDNGWKMLAVFGIGAAKVAMVIVTLCAVLFGVLLWTVLAFLGASPGEGQKKS